MDAKHAGELIRAERQRQIDDEGWTAEHDDRHDDGALLRAAVFYLHHGTDRFPSQTQADGSPMGWPWEAKWWKPKDRKSNLIRAGALCLAEKDRLRRARAIVSHIDHKYRLCVSALIELVE